jgi:hypothetical protein
MTIATAGSRTGSGSGLKEAVASIEWHQSKRLKKANKKKKTGLRRVTATRGIEAFKLE